MNVDDLPSTVYDGLLLLISTLKVYFNTTEANPYTRTLSFDNYLYYNVYYRYHASVSFT